MEIRNMAGWCLILFGLINVLHAVHLHFTAGGEVGTLYRIITSLLFTGGAACLMLKFKSPKGAKT
jgi:hypothetical protein